MSPTSSTLTPGGTTGAEGTERLIRAAHVILDNCGMTLGPRKVHRIVRTFEARVAHNGWSFFDFLATSIQLDADRRVQLLNDPDVQRVIAYADPTGETAVRNVIRAAG